jgi:hypothetical protein
MDCRNRTFQHCPLYQNLIKTGLRLKEGKPYWFSKQVSQSIESNRAGINQSSSSKKQVLKLYRKEQ